MVNVFNTWGKNNYFIIAIATDIEKLHSLFESCLQKEKSIRHYETFLIHSSYMNMFIPFNFQIVDAQKKGCPLNCPFNCNKIPEKLERKYIHALTPDLRKYLDEIIEPLSLYTNCDYIGYDMLVDGQHRQFY